MFRQKQTSPGSAYERGNWRKLFELIADPVLFRWLWDGGVLAGGRGLQGLFSGICIQEGPEELFWEEDVDLNTCVGHCHYIVIVIMLLGEIL